MMCACSSTTPIGSGIAVILDVVYNHLGPVGNVLHEFSDWYFAEHETEWGTRLQPRWSAFGAGARVHAAPTCATGFDEYHFDGLRFDAIHSIVDRSSEHIVHELTRMPGSRGATPAVRVAENEAQNVAFLKDDERQGPGRARRICGTRTGITRPSSR